MHLQEKQDGYLPPGRSIQEGRNRGLPEQYVQDGYLPPAKSAALSISDLNPLSDDRMGGPR
jgi:hypothetical protein